MSNSLDVATLARYFFIDGAARNLSPSTQRFYKGKLCFLLEAYGDCPADSLTVYQLRELIATLQREHDWTVTQVNHVITAIRILFTYAVREELIERNPATRLQRMKVERPLLEVLSLEDVQALLAVIPNTFVGIRNRCMILMLIDTGIRLHELISLTTESINLNTLTLQVWGKGRKARIVPFSPVFARVLVKYLTHRAKKLQDNQPTPALWINRQGRQLSYYYMSHQLQLYGAAARITKHVHPHGLRHLFATEFLRNGGNPLSLQRILGHESQVMTARYVHLTDADSAREHRTASPLEHWRNLTR